ncbi:hypothetical protein F5Y16DRAFT_354628 [Xylariaceae sp. FL0255]|nr:hypothetical protein F5Y16DRAFT_354628 [Xylariaceae sp. FL0255]
MEWIGRPKSLLSGDIGEFDFFPNQPCTIRTIRLKRNNSGAVEISENQCHNSETEYLQWIDQSESWSDEASVALVLHHRLDTGSNDKISLPYGENTLKQAFSHLYQHRSVTDAVRRKSPATFTSKPVAAWKSKPEWGPAVVYICKSDTISPLEADDLVLSVTHFPARSIIMAVAYGCTGYSQNFIDQWLKYSKAFAFSPLFLPILWAELERQRLIDRTDLMASDLHKRVIDMNRILGRDEKNGKSLQSGNTEISIGGDAIKMVQGTSQNGIAQRECAAVNLWVSVSALKNGLEAFRSVLKSMLDSLRTPRKDDERIFGKSDHEQFGPVERHARDMIEYRLTEMTVEIECKVRYTNSLLEGMALATQTESNHLSRRDALTNIYIAVESKKDSSHMRYIAFLGMIFLPGTFFATLFSMTFFNWIPQNSNQVVSPWLAMYLGFTVVSTGATVWRFQTWAKKRDDEAEQNINSQLEMLLPLTTRDVNSQQSEEV